MPLLPLFFYRQSLVKKKTENTTFAMPYSVNIMDLSMRLLFFALYLLMVAPGVYTMQQPVETKTQSIRQSYSFSPYPGPGQDIVNTILGTLAQGQGRLRVYTSYELYLTLRMEFYEDAEDGVILHVFADKIDIEGNTSYKDFSLSHLLLPDKATFNVMVSDGDQGIVYSGEYAGMEAPEQGALWLEITFPYKGGIRELEARLSDAVFYYDDRTLERILLWDQSLQDYYTAPARLGTIRDLIRDMDPNDPENILIEEFRLCEAEALMGVISFEPFHHWLDLPNNDPLAFIPAYEALKSQIDSLRSAFNHSIVYIDSLFYHRGMTLSRAQSPAHGRPHFLSAITYNPFHIPAHLALAGEDRLLGNKEDALNRIESIMTLMRPDPVLRRETHLLADSVLEMFFDAARGMIAEERHTSALKILSHACSFCSSVEGHYPCPDRLHALLAQSHKGVYRSFLVVAGRALRNDNLDFARTYLQTAGDYQQEHSDFIPHDAEVTALLFRVFTRYRVLAETYEMQDAADEAGRYVAATGEMARNHPSLFDHARHSQMQEIIQTGVLNYAAAGMPRQSAGLLRALKELGVEPGAVEYHQRVAGIAAARYYRSMPGPENDTEDLVRELTGNDPWFATFVRYFTGRR